MQTYNFYGEMGGKAEAGNTLTRPTSMLYFPCGLSVRTSRYIT